MAAALASLLEDFSPCPKSESLGIEILRAVKPPVEAGPVQTPPPVDRQADIISSVEARVRAEEKEAAQRRLEEAIAAERARHEDELSAQRLIWVEQEAGQLSSQIVEAMGRLEVILSDRVANILKPFVGAAFRQQSIVEFKEVLATILLGDEERSIRIVGPEDVVQAMKDKLGSRRGAIEFIPGDHVEVSAAARDTTIQTQLGPWAERLGQALEAQP